MEDKEIIVIGGSAGSINVLLKLLPLIEKDRCLPIIIIIHRKPTDENVLSTLLQFKTKITIKEIEDKMPIEINTIYLAPANYHVLLEKDKSFTLDDSEKVNYSRPNIDVCMHSVTQIYGNKTIGILLTGANDDGAIGLKMIHDMGGYTIIQKPETCLFSIMPQHAEKLSKPDLKLTPEGIAEFLTTI